MSLAWCVFPWWYCKTAIPWKLSPSMPCTLQQVVLYQSMGGYSQQGCWHPWQAAPTWFLQKRKIPWKYRQQVQTWHVDWMELSICSTSLMHEKGSLQGKAGQGGKATNLVSIQHNTEAEIIVHTWRPPFFLLLSAGSHLIATTLWSIQV